MRELRTGHVVVALVVVAALVGLDTGKADGGGVAATPTELSITVTVKLDARGRGTFTLGGGLGADHGSVGLFQQQVGGAVRATVRLRGTRGVIVLASSQVCTKGSGTWRVVSGTGAYRGITGNGTTAGRARCVRPFRSSTVVYRGLVGLPPASLAQPGAWGGWTAQDKALSFTVTSDGRAIADVFVGTHRQECVRSDGRRTLSNWDDTTYAGPFAIADNRTFSVKVGSATLDGRFAGTRAEGSITYAYSLPPDVQGRTTSCSGSIPWTATTPPPPPRLAPAGRYCGFAREGEGVCLTVLESGREVRSLEVGLFLDCSGNSGFYVRLTYDVLVRVQSDLSFRSSGTAKIEDGSALAFLSGTFDHAGGMSGVLTLQQPRFTYQGVSYTCRNSSANFTARLQR